MTNIKSKKASAFASKKKGPKKEDDTLVGALYYPEIARDQLPVPKLKKRTGY